MLFVILYFAIVYIFSMDWFSLSNCSIIEFLLYNVRCAFYKYQQSKKLLVLYSCCCSIKRVILTLHLSKVTNWIYEIKLIFTSKNHLNQKIEPARTTSRFIYNYSKVSRLCWIKIALYHPFPNIFNETATVVLI